MSSEVPYIGSKISLISKAKVRYEGYLYTIDQEKLTVTLAKVKTFGTENRTEEVVPPKNEIYEYVVFRGKDIEDLVVCETPQRYSQDPAIVQFQEAAIELLNESDPPPQINHCSFQTGSATHTGNGGPSFDNSQPQHPHHPMQNQYASTPPYYGYGPFAGSVPNAGQYGGNVPHPQMHPSQVSQPINQSTVKPANESSSTKTSMEEKPHTSSTSASEALSYSSAASSSVKSQSNSHTSKPRSDSKGGKSDNDNSRRNDEKKSHSNNHEVKNEDKGRQRKDSTERKPRQRRSHDGQSGTQKSNQNKPKSTFTEEFDFQSANAKFNKEEIEEELLKTLRKSLKLPDKNESSASEELESNTSVNSNSVVLPDELPSPDRCYDKTKSFFDSISCEAASKNDRFRSQERKLNVETFGVSSSYRGRSYSRGRGRGGRGGGRGGWTNNRSNRGRGNWSNRGRGRGTSTATNSD